MEAIYYSSVKYHR